MNRIQVGRDTTAGNFESLRVFISYPRGGHAHNWAGEVQCHLENLGAKVWRDENSIREGEQDWYRRIEQGIERSDVLTCIVSQDTDACQWQEREMLRAVQLGKPVVPLRIAKVSLPLYIQEKQAVEARPDHGQTLRLLTEALAAAWREARVEANIETTDTAQAPATQQRQREIDYLNDLIHDEYSDRAQRYVPLAGRERQSHSLARSMKGLRIDTDAVLRAFRMDAPTREASRETNYPDVLEAYRSLQQRPIRRLAVLGEPGAGKSFSLERIAIEYAERALQDAQAPIPLLVPLGFWTREAVALDEFIEGQLGELGRYFRSLRDQKRAVLLLDAMNEIPPGQRKLKAGQIQRLAEDTRFASVVVSCREKDFAADFSLPFDTLSLQPLTPTQIRSFLHRALPLHLGADVGPAEAETRFWRIAGGKDWEELRQAWEAWQRAGADLALFWSAEDIPRADPDVYSATSELQNGLWRRVRFDPRNLIRLAANPYLLTVMTALPAIPANRAQLFEGFLEVLFEREREAREKRHDGARVPDRGAWEAALVELAETLQRAGGAYEADGARTALSEDDWPKSLSPAIIDFSVDASVLQVKGNDIRFTHQLLQEYLASRLLLAASRSAARPAADFWPAATWWERSGWEVVAEIAAESCGFDAQAQARLIAWLAEANPEVACEVWRRLGQPAVPVLAGIVGRWLPRMTDVGLQSHPHARAAIGRALGRFGLDRRPGVGLRADGLPAIDWVKIPSTRFVYQEREHPALPTFHLARYPVTNTQYQAFIAAGGYREDAWWTGLAQRFDAPAQPAWDEPNAPREAVSWYEAVAFCRWLGDRLGYPISLPTELQWERAARGTQGFEYPWGEGYRAGYANCQETDQSSPYHVGRTTAVGIYPQAGSPEGVLDLAGNVWEWCLNEYDSPQKTSLRGDVSRVLRGGAWLNDPWRCRAAYRRNDRPDGRFRGFGFWVCCAAPIE